MIVHQLVGRMAGRLPVVEEGASCANPLAGYDNYGCSYGSSKYSSIDGTDGNMYEKAGGEETKGEQVEEDRTGSSGPPR